MCHRNKHFVVVLIVFGEPSGPNNSEGLVPIYVAERVRLYQRKSCFIKVY